METQGYFGKTPFARDFLYQGLPMRVTDAWAEPMARWLAIARQKAGAEWQRSYLGSPVWCFALARGMISAEAWVGLFASSIDSVGREFPMAAFMTVADPLPAGRPTAWLNGLLDPLEAQMLAFMEGQIQAAEFARALEAAAKALRTNAGTASGAALPLPAGADALCLVENEAGEAALAWPGSAGDVEACLWWHEATRARPAELCLSRGMPAAGAGPLFFLGDWASHGWQPATNPVVLPHA